MEASYIHLTSDRKFSDLYLCYCGYDECASGHSFGTAVRPHYLLHYILKGKGQYHIGEKRYHLSAGQGFLIFPTDTDILSSRYLRSMDLYLGRF